MRGSPADSIKPFFTNGGQNPVPRRIDGAVPILSLALLVSSGNGILRHALVASGTELQCLRIMFLEAQWPHLQRARMIETCVVRHTFTPRQRKINVHFIQGLNNRTRKKNVALDLLSCVHTCAAFPFWGGIPVNYTHGTYFGMHSRLLAFTSCLAGPMCDAGRALSCTCSCAHRPSCLLCHAGLLYAWLTPLNSLRRWQTSPVYLHSSLESVASLRK